MEFDMSDYILNGIRVHAAEDVPNEACGVIVQHAAQRHEVVRMRNAARGKADTLYQFDPYEQEKVWRYARDVRAEICAVYHSHPSHGPEPSALDHALAAIEIPWYLIYGVKGDCFAAYRPTRFGLEWMPLVIRPPVGRVDLADHPR